MVRTTVPTELGCTGANEASAVACAELENQDLRAGSQHLKDKIGAVASVFASEARCLVVIDESAVAVKFFVHEIILNKLPYFEAREARWDKGDAGNLRLPGSCSHADFGAILSRLYSLETRWSPPDWVRILGEDLSAAFSVLLLLKMFLANSLVPEVLAVVRQLASDADSRKWLQHATDGLDIPELEGYGREPSPVVFLESVALQQAALDAMKSSADGRRLFKAILSKREAVGLADQDTATLISVFRDHASYITLNRIHSLSDMRPTSGPAFRRRAVDFFRPFSIPVEGFAWLWKLIEDGVERNPSLFYDALDAFRSLQWLEHVVNANRHGEESALGSRRLLYVPEVASKQAIRRAYASFLMLGLRLLTRGHIGVEALLEAFSCGVAQATDHAPHTRHNLLQFQPLEHPSAGYVYGADVVAAVLSGIGDDARTTVLAMVPQFKDWQWAFTPRAVRCLSEPEQVACVRSCTISWLTGEVCAALHRRARALAEAKLAPGIGKLDEGQRAFMWEGL